MRLLMESLCLAAMTTVIGAMGHSAEVVLVPGSNPNIKGHLYLTAHYGGVSITGTVSGLTPGKHGFHFHEKGDLGDSCKAAGGHFNPFKRTHGSPVDIHRHVGDLGNIVADQYGTAKIAITDSHISLDRGSTACVLGLAVVIHAGEDDLGRGGDEGSLKTGNAGARDGCGLVRAVVGPIVRPRPIAFPSVRYYAPAGVW